MRALRVIRRIAFAGMGVNALFSQDVTPEKLAAALRTRLSSPRQAAHGTSREEPAR
jgi:hypothetical protein